MTIDRRRKGVRTGESVAAPVTNRQPYATQANVENLYDLVLSLAAGRSLVLPDARLTTTCRAGTPVYFDAVTAKFTPAIAATDATGRLSASALLWGIVKAKTTATMGDVILGGVAAVDLAAVVEDAAVAGTYYLSAAEAGKLTTSPPAIEIPVLRSDGNGTVFVLCPPADPATGRTTEMVELRCAPAGDYTPPAPGDSHVIENADSSLPGWLPASDSVFGGHAPEDAVFGYNLSAHTELAGLWPPSPIGSASIDWDRGDGIGMTGVPLGEQGLCIVDANGIWWLSNCNGDAPWPADYVDGVSASLSESECPRDLVMRMFVRFGRSNIASSGAVVQSLRSRDSRLLVTGPDGNPAVGGNLYLNLDLGLGITEGNRGYQAIKGIEGDKFLQGPVVEGLISDSANVILSGDASFTQDDEEVHQGIVRVSFIAQPTIELDVELFRLSGVELGQFQGTTYLSFRPERATDIRGKIYVPATIGITSPTVALRFLLLGRGAGDLPVLTVTGRRIPRVLVATDLPTTGDEFDIDLAYSVTVTANQYIEVETDPFEVAAGDTLFFTVSRADDDGYTADLGLIRANGLLAAG